MAINKTVNGKTINQLVRIDEIRGDEIFPLSFRDEATGNYVTRGITFDDMMAKFYEYVKKHEADILALEASADDLNRKHEAQAVEINNLSEATNQIADSTIALVESTSILKDKTAQLANDTASLKESTNQIQSEMDDVKSDVNSLESEMTNVKSEVSNIDNNYNELESSITTVSTTLQQQQVTIEHHGESIEEHKNAIAENKTNITNVKADLSELTAYTHAEFTENDATDTAQTEDIDEIAYIINDPFQSW